MPETAHTMVPIVDLARFRERGWQAVRFLGTPPKDVLMSKATAELTDDEREQRRMRGG